MNFSRPPRTIFLTLFRCSSVMTPKVRSTDVTPLTEVIAVVTSFRNRSCIGHAEIVSKTVTLTAPLLSSRSSTIPKSVIGWRSSGSWTLANASTIWSIKLTVDLDQSSPQDDLSLVLVFHHPINRQLASLGKSLDLDP